MRRLLSAAQATEYHLPVHRALFSGLRKGEVLGLDWREVDTDARTIQVRQALLYNSKTGCFYGEPKSRGSGRTVAIPQLACLLLRGRRELLQGEMAERAGPAAEIPGQVCAFWDGRLMKPTTLDKTFRRLGHTTVKINGHVLAPSDVVAGDAFERVAAPELME